MCDSANFHNSLPLLKIGRVSYSV